MRKVVNSKYDGATKEILDIIELFQPIGTCEIITLAGLENNHAFGVGVIHALAELGHIVRDDDTGLYWHTPFNVDYIVK